MPGLPGQDITIDMRGVVSAGSGVSHGPVVELGVALQTRQRQATLATPGKAPQMPFARRTSQPVASVAVASAAGLCLRNRVICCHLRPGICRSRHFSGQALRTGYTPVGIAQSGLRLCQQLAKGEGLLNRKARVGLSAWARLRGAQPCGKFGASLAPG